MKRLLFLSACILFMGATMVQADTINVTATRTSYNATLDEVDLHIVSFVGIPPNDVITILLGTWTANGGGFNLPGTSSTWYNNISNNFDAQDRAAPQTMLDFSTKMPDSATRSGSSPYASFYVGYAITPADMSGIPGFALGTSDLTPGAGPDPNPWWDPTGGDDGNGAWTDHQGYAFDNTLLGKFYVSKATTWTAGQTVFSGIGAYCLPVGGGAVSGDATNVVIVPEPSTLALLGCGLFGLLAYAWRKRK